MTALVGICTAALLGLMAWKIAQGRNWARWVFAIIYILGTLGSVAVITPAVFLAHPLVLQANMILQFILQTAAAVLVFTSSARQWFKAKGASVAP